MSKHGVRKIRRLKRRHRQELNEATAYLVARVETDEEEIAALRGENAALAQSRHAMRDELMTMTMRLAMAHGFVAAINATARGESGCIAVPMLVVEDVIPGKPWWR